MASGHITLLEIDGETVERVSEFIWGGGREFVGIHSEFELQVGTTLVNKQTHTQLSQSLQGSLIPPQAHQGDISETVLSWVKEPGITEFWRGRMMG